MCHSGFPALIIGVEVRFGAGIHGLKAGIPAIVKNMQVKYPFLRD